MICNCCGASVPDAPFCCQCGTPQKPMTLGALHESWKKVHYRRIGKKGIEGYETAWRVLGVLADKPVVSLTLEDYQAVMDSIAEYSFSKQQKLRQLISQLCQYAQIRKIDTSNYAPFLILDGYRSKSRLILSDEEINRLFFYAVSAKGKYWEAAQITLILVLTGMRPEELFEVKKADVDLAAGKIYTAGSKTEAGRDRTIPIAQPIAPFLLYLTLRHPDCPYLVTSPKGCRISLTNWRKRKFFPLMQELGINPPDDLHRIVPYSCRHTYAGLAKRAGVDAGILAKMIGHADPKITEEVYIHENLTQMQQEVAKITRLTQSITGVSMFFCKAPGGVA